MSYLPPVPAGYHLATAKERRGLPPGTKYWDMYARDWKNLSPRWHYRPSAEVGTGTFVVPDAFTEKQDATHFITHPPKPDPFEVWYAQWLHDLGRHTARMAYDAALEAKA